MHSTRASNTPDAKAIKPNILVVVVGAVVVVVVHCRYQKKREFAVVEANAAFDKEKIRRSRAGGIVSDLEHIRAVCRHSATYLQLVAQCCLLAVGTPCYLPTTAAATQLR